VAPPPEAVRRSAAGWPARIACQRMLPSQKPTRDTLQVRARAAAHFSHLRHKPWQQFPTLAVGVCLSSTACLVSSWSEMLTSKPITHSNCTGIAQSLMSPDAPVWPALANCTVPVLLVSGRAVSAAQQQQCPAAWLNGSSNTSNLLGTCWHHAPPADNCKLHRQDSTAANPDSIPAADCGYRGHCDADPRPAGAGTADPRCVSRTHLLASTSCGPDLHASLPDISTDSDACF